MKKIALVGLILMNFSCSESTVGGANEPGKDSDLPEKYSSLVIRWNDGGGMLDMSESIYLSEERSEWIFHKDGHDKKIEFTSSTKELSDLYNYLREQSFDKIKTHSEGQIYDRGGIDIYVDVDDKTFKVNNSGSTMLVDKWVSNWKNCSSKIHEFAEQKVAEKRFPLQLLLDSSINTDEYFIRLTANEELLAHTEDESLNQKQLDNGWDIQAFPAENEFELHLYYKDSTNSYGGKISYASERFWEELNPDIKKITLLLNEGKLDIKID